MVGHDSNRIPSMASTIAYHRWSRNAENEEDMAICQIIPHPVMMLAFPNVEPPSTAFPTADAVNKTAARNPQPILQGIPPNRLTKPMTLPPLPLFRMALRAPSPSRSRKVPRPPVLIDLARRLCIIVSTRRAGRLWHRSARFRLWVRDGRPLSVDGWCGRRVGGVRREGGGWGGRVGG
jgi:hypothetical protein